jgi:hypothetical protein
MGEKKRTPKSNARPKNESKFGEELVIPPIVPNPHILDFGGQGRRNCVADVSASFHSLATRNRRKAGGCNQSPLSIPVIFSTAFTSPTGIDFHVWPARSERCVAISTSFSRI